MHPKLASGIFAIAYSIVFGGLMLGIFKINLFEHAAFYIIGGILDIIIYEWFAHRYEGEDNV
jgi:hypothetical protein